MVNIKKTTVLCVLFLAVYCVFSEVEAKDECQDDDDCDKSSLFKKYCCKRKYPNDSVCMINCIFESCNVDTDCAPGECCDSDDHCRSFCDHDVVEGLAGWIVAVIVISIIVVIVILVAVVIFCCCCAAAASRRPAHGGVIVTAQPATTTGATAVLTTQNQQHYPAGGAAITQPMYFHNFQPYSNQPPPAYQPTGTVYPPPMAMTAQTEVKP